MATTVYVTNPQITAPNLPNEIVLCYSMYVCDADAIAVFHPPCNEDTLVILTFGDTAGIAKQKIIDNVVAHVAGIGPNDVFFIPEIGTGA